jgi:hypothetical protein
VYQVQCVHTLTSWQSVQVRNGHKCAALPHSAELRKSPCTHCSLTVPSLVTVIVTGYDVPSACYKKLWLGLPTDCGSINLNDDVQSKHPTHCMPCLTAPNHAAAGTHMRKCPAGLRPCRSHQHRCNMQLSTTSNGQHVVRSGVQMQHCTAGCRLCSPLQHNSLQ